jgi:bacterioferritin
MRGDEDVIELLNDVLTGELTAINQYFIDTKMCVNWGYDRLAERVREESMEEMRDAEELIDRILYLEGIPNLQRLGTVRIGESVPEQLKLALEQEKLAIDRLNDGINLCRGKGDNGSREVLEKILQGEEEHAAWLETQLHLIGVLGENVYLAQQVRAE